MRLSNIFNVELGKEIWWSRRSLEQITIRTSKINSLKNLRAKGNQEESPDTNKVLIKFKLNDSKFKA